MSSLLQTLGIGSRGLSTSETSLSVTAVCAMGGYASRAHAVKMFRRITGTTPSEYRERMRETRG